MHLVTRVLPAGEMKSNVSNRFDANWNLVTLMKQVQNLVTYQKIYFDKIKFCILNLLYYDFFKKTLMIIWSILFLL